MGSRFYTYEERQKAMQEEDAIRSSYGNQDQSQYVDYTAPDPNAGQQQQQVQQAEAPRYWTPQQIHLQYIADQANPNPLPDEIRPGGASREGIAQANNYYSIINNNAPVTDWKDLEQDHYYDVIIKPNWGDPTVVQPATVEDPLGAILPATPDYGKGNWNDLNWLGKTYNMLSSSNTAEGAPEWKNLTAALIPAATSAGGGAALGSVAAALATMAGLATPVMPAAIIGGAAVAAATFVQSAFGVKIPILNQVLEAIDIAATKSEQVWGTAEQSIYRNEVENAGEFVLELAKLGLDIDSKLGDKDNFYSKMAAASARYETKTTGLGDTTIDLINKAYNLFNEDQMAVTKPGETYQYNRGLMDAQQIQTPEGPEALDMLAGVASELVKTVNPATGKEYTYREASDLVQQWATDAFGTTAQFNELIESSIYDPANLVPFISSYAVKKVGDITGNVPLAKAGDVHMGNPFIDALPPVVQQMAEAVAHKFGKRGGSQGFFSVLDTYQNVLRYGTKLDTMTAGQITNAKLTADGKFAELQPTNRTGRFGWFQSLFDQTPESKTMQIMSMNSDMVTAIASGSATNAEFINNIYALISDTAPEIDSTVAGIWGTAAWKTGIDSLRTSVEKGGVKALSDIYDTTVGNRAALFDISNAIGKQQKDVVTLADENPDLLKSMIVDYATQHEGKVGNLIVDDAGDSAIAMLKLYTGKEPIAWNDNIFRYEVAANISDGLSDVLIERYGIKEDRTIFRLSNLMKKAQSVLLLGLSPSYTANNLMNNIVTRASVGAIGAVTLGQYTTFLEKSGIFPARFAEDAGLLRGDSVDAATPYGKASQKIADVKRKGDLIDTAGDAIGQAKKVSLDKLNRKIESSEGQRAFGAGIMQYFHREWKMGKDFRRMDKALETVIEMQSPGLSKFIYANISKNYNMGDIEKSLYAAMYTPDASDVLNSIGKRLFPNDPYVVSEIFDKSGITNDIQERLKNAKTRAEREQVIEDIRNDAAKYRDRMMQNQIANMAEAVGNIVTTEALPAVNDLLINQAVYEADHWSSHIKAMSRSYEMKEKAGLSDTAWVNYISSTMARTQQDWKHSNQISLQMDKGIIEKLGMDNLIGREYGAALVEMHNVRREFFNNRGELFNEASRKTKDINSNKKLTDLQKAEQVRAAWDNFYDQTEAAYKDYFDNHEAPLMMKRGDLFVKGFEEATGADSTNLRTMFDQLLTIRKEMADAEVEVHKKTREIRQSNMERSAKDQASNQVTAEHNVFKNAKIQEMRDINQTIANESAKDGFVARAENGVKVPEKPVVGTEAEQVKSAIDFQNFAKEADIGKKAAQTATQGYLDRDGIRNEYIDNNYSEAEADLLMELYDNAASTWEAKNPGKNFYTEGLRLREISKGADTKTDPFLSQVETITEADINTEAFRKFFDGSKVVNEDGSPKVVYHGSPNQFEAFNYDRMGTTGTVEGYGFYFTDSMEMANSYTKSDGSGSVYESYVDIKKPISNDTKEMTRADIKKLLKAIDKADMASDEPVHWTLSMFGDTEREGVSNVLQKATESLFSNNDLDVVTEIINLAGHDPERIYRIVKDTLGYDGIITKWAANPERAETNIYIPFLPEQIKSIYNEGTWDKQNPNMLFQAAPAVDSARFKKWFGDSKVVDADGNPLVVHHGSSATFDTFSKEKLGSNTGSPSAKKGFFFAADVDTTRTYSMFSLGDYQYGEWDKAIAKKRYDFSDIEQNATYDDYIKLRDRWSKYSPPELNRSEALQRAEYGIDTMSEDIYYGYGGNMAEANYNDYASDIAEYNAILDDYDHYISTDESFPKPNVYDVYLKIENPYTYDYKGLSRDISYNDVIKTAIENNHDGVILKNTRDGGPLTDIYVIFEPEQVKSIDNTGTWDSNNPNMLYQDRIKGAFEVIDGDAFVRFMKAKDMSTAVHETGHLFRRTLDNTQMSDFTQWAGFDSAETFQSLEYRYWNDPKSLTDAEKKLYIDTEEKFARGFEQYLIEGSAPTIGLKVVFHKFANYLLNIYKAVKNFISKDYSRQGEFVFDGQVLDIKAEINGVKLRDIFDSMLTDDVQRSDSYDTIISKRIDTLSDNVKYRTWDKEKLYKQAKREVNSEILNRFGDFESAEYVASTMKEPLAIADDMIVDDIALYEAIADAKSSELNNPFAKTNAKNAINTQGNITTANGINDPSRVYEFKYKLVDMKDVIPSHSWRGNQLEDNFNYDSTLQPRARDQVQSIMQIDNIAKQLVPDLLLMDYHAIDKGAPIVGETNNVESGNGRVLSLQRAMMEYPDQWKAYQNELRNILPEYGIDPVELVRYENPILVRERLTQIDPVEFAREANKPIALQMTTMENAVNDADLIDTNSLSNLDILSDETIEGALAAKRNNGFVQQFMKKLSENEAAQYSYQDPHTRMMTLNEAGRRRIINAIFAKVYGEEGSKLLQSFTMSTDSNIKIVESALKDSLPAVAKTEGMIQNGQRPADLSIASDVAIAAEKLSELRKNGEKVENYVNQIGLPGLDMELSPLQKEMLVYFSEQRSAKNIRNLLREYASQVENQADVDQGSLFEMSPATKEQLLQIAKDKISADNQDQQSALFQTGESSESAYSFEPKEFENPDDALFYYDQQQEAYDRGTAVPLEDTANIELTGWDPFRINELRQNLYDLMLDGMDPQYHEYGRAYADSVIGNKDAMNDIVSRNAEVPEPIRAEFYHRYMINEKLISDINRERDIAANMSVNRIPEQGFYLKRMPEEQFGEFTIIGNVFRDGQLVAYYPYNLTNDPIQTGDGRNIKLLGVDPNNAEQYVYYDALSNEVDTVNVQNPKGFENAYVQSEGETLVNRGTPLGTTPMIEVDGTANNEILNDYIYPILDEFLPEYEKASGEGIDKNLGQLDQDTRVRIGKYLDDVINPDMASSKFNAMKFGEFKRDAALLNYSKTYGFDSYLTMISPYQFWYTRSMMNWAKRIVDKPAYLTMAMRMKKMAERNKKEEYPYRLNDLFRIPFAGLPDWMGGGIFVDILPQIFPFLQFGDPVEDRMSDQNTLNKKAYSVLDEMIEANQITEAQKTEAIRTKNNDTWNTAMAQAKLENGEDYSSKSLFEQYFSLPLFISWAKDIYEGKENQIGMLPITRFGNTIGTLTDDTFLEGLGQITKSAMTAPEKAMRKIAGIDYKEFGEYEDYNIKKQIMQMVLGGLPVDQGLNAMNEMQGDIYDEAVKRQREENALKTQGALPIYQMKRLLQGEEDASMGSVLASLALAPLGAKIYPTGEKAAREAQTRYNQAFIDRDNGDTEALSRFWDEDEEYTARLASFKDDPEELLRYTLHTYAKNFYYDQPKAQQQAILNNYGPEFYRTVIDTSTSNWKEADLQKLAFWAQGLTGNIPNVPQLEAVRNQKQTLQFYAPQVVSEQELYYEEGNRLFPGQSAKKTPFYDLDKTQKAAYLKIDPVFAQYMQWDSDFLKAHPNIQTVKDDRSDYYDELMAYDSFGEMSESVVNDFDHWAVTGLPMRGATTRVLNNLWKKHANTTFNDYDEYLEILKRYRE